MNPTRRQELEAALATRILVADGATGTWLQGRGLTAMDFGGTEFEGCNEHLNLTRPEVITELHRAHLHAGADIVETNTFGGTSIVLAEYELAERAVEINRAAARIARSAVDEVRAGGRPAWVAGSMGPTTKAISVTGGVSFAELRLAYRDQALGLLEGGVDLLMVETVQDTRNAKAAMLGIEEAVGLGAPAVPVILSCTIEPTGTMLAGQGTEAFYASVSHWRPLAVGLNCGTGPEFMTDHLRQLAATATTLVACLPNAGLPDADGHYRTGPTELARKMRRFAERGWVNLIGGCCGTTPEHVRALVEAVAGLPPRTPRLSERHLLSGIDLMAYADDERPVLVGERTNVIGSRKFKRLIGAGAWDEAAEVGRAQVRGGAQIVDVCLADPDRDEQADMKEFLERATRMVRAPLMIDSTDPEVIETALSYCQGKAVINSVNLEDGGTRLAQVMRLVRRYGAALVVGLIDERGMAVSRERKLEIARRVHTMLCKEEGLAEADIIWDPLTFPCATGDAAYMGSAVETVEAIELLKAAFPQAKTILGISNVSFGLPTAGREVLNSVFLYHATRAGLDLAIVNPERLERYPSIGEEDVGLAEDLLWNRGKDPVAPFAARFRGSTSRADRRIAEDRPLDERIAGQIVQGTRLGLTELLEAKLQQSAALEIVNGPLMDGMAEVGRLFAGNQLIIAEVLQSAEVMKLAVSFLEPHLDRRDEISRGTVLLATVQGDVHDIGKNLVHTIFANNGYGIIDLGVKVSPAALIAAAREHQPDLIGLSGLLVRSAHQMVATTQDLREAGIDIPILVGGAALSERFVLERIAPVYRGPVDYAPDAMTGLKQLGQILAGGSRSAAPAEFRVREQNAAILRRTPRPRVLAAEEIPAVPDTQRHIEGPIPVDQLLPWINPQMLYGRHLGLKGKVRKLLAKQDERALELVRKVEQVAAAEPLLVRAMWRFLPVAREGNSISFFAPDGELRGVLTLPRQPGAEGRCLADYVQPGQGDHLALFVTTAGEGVRERASVLREEGELLASHILQALALELAEAAAEWLHARLRAAWGFADSAELTMTDRFRAAYRGKRFSFGYGACPELADQKLIFDLLEPEEIGVSLTDGFMMEPEASVSALVFHHPDARYFAVQAKGEF